MLAFHVTVHGIDTTVSVQAMAKKWQLMMQPPYLGLDITQMVVGNLLLRAELEHQPGPLPQPFPEDWNGLRALVGWETRQRREVEARKCRPNASTDLGCLHVRAGHVLVQQKLFHTAVGKACLHALKALNGDQFLQSCISWSRGRQL